MLSGKYGVVAPVTVGQGFGVGYKGCVFEAGKLWALRVLSRHGARSRWTMSFLRFTAMTSMVLAALSLLLLCTLVLCITLTIRTTAHFSLVPN